MINIYFHQNQNKSKIEERIEWIKNIDKKGPYFDLELERYPIVLEDLYKLASKKTKEILPLLEELIEYTGPYGFYTNLLEAIRDYIRDDIPPIKYQYRWEKLKIPTYKEKDYNLKESLKYLANVLKAFGDYIGNNIYYIGKYIWNNMYNKTKIYHITSSYREKIQNLEKGLEYLLNLEIRTELHERYLQILRGEFISLNIDLTNKELDWKTIRTYAQKKAASDYLRSHIKCLLSNPDGYMQHMKAGDLGAFIRDSCKSTPS
jgi:hypothetical protein